MDDRRTYIDIEGWEAEVDVAIVLTGGYGVALMLEGPMVGYEILLSPEWYRRCYKKWKQENETDD